MWQERIVNYLFVGNFLYGLSYLIRVDNVVSNWIAANLPIRPELLGFVIILSAGMIKILYGRNHDNWEKMSIFLVPGSIAAALIVIQVFKNTVGVASFAPPQHAVGHTLAIFSFWLAWGIGSLLDNLVTRNIQLREQLESLMMGQETINDTGPEK